MLAPIKHLLNNYRIVLASGSPRRKELVQMLGLNAELCPSTFEENLDRAEFKSFSDYIEATALGKAEEVYQRLNNDGDGRQLIVIAADTMVTLGNEIFGKPKDADDAVRMLTKLSGACNRVFTGVVLKHSNGVRQFTDTADVYFGQLTEEQIRSYVDSGDPLDKAGSYGVNGPGGALIPRIDGDFYCVMGLPLNRLCCELNKLFLEDL
ncbi:PREDICTED: septum formation protein Maf isoform X1 [Drosophila arizonae]|uniref:Septum formation protein Maf isoform X1 n=1 Tax=Drosophila arizonae TaxID=7263 RepID=A0ABM1NVT3_DROAR|nr:PREDICTED: septum formation protein Maf isoform X1 [Drosophila arizonae]